MKNFHIDGDASIFFAKSITDFSFKEYNSFKSSCLNFVC